MATDTTALNASEYLAFERESQLKHEWIDGEIREMTSASLRHVAIVLHLGSFFRIALRGQAFQPFTSDMRVRVPDGPYYYPDVGVAPKPPRMEEDSPDTLLNPLVLAEVLSPSTAHIDRDEKLRNYCLIPSLSAYLIVSQDEPRIDVYRREADGSWRFESIAGAEQAIALPALNCHIPFAEVYDGVFPSTHDK